MKKPGLAGSGFFQDRVSFGVTTRRTRSLPETWTQYRWSSAAEGGSFVPPVVAGSRTLFWRAGMGQARTPQCRRNFFSGRSNAARAKL